MIAEFDRSERAMFTNVVGGVLFPYIDEDDEGGGAGVEGEEEASTATNSPATRSRPRARRKRHSRVVIHSNRVQKIFPKKFPKPSPPENLPKRT